MKVAFYAPIKPPDHPIASGDRLIARNLVAALELAGHQISVASSFIAYSKKMDAAVLENRRIASKAEISEVICRLKDDPPDVWLTYHPYCKAPDWLGPAIKREMGVPLVTVEAARTAQGREGGSDLWRDWRAEAQAGLREADLHIWMKPQDRDYLKTLGVEEDRLAQLSPFIDVDTAHNSGSAEFPSHWRADHPVLFAAGMMRPGKKVENYRFLSEALLPLQALHWNLAVAGGGPALDEVREFFEVFDPSRIHFAGGVERHDVLAMMRAADLFVWPGWREPIGMVYLEAQLMGMPVVAFADMGVPLVVAHGETGLLAAPDDVAALGEAIAQLISHPTLRPDLAARGPAHVRANHSIETASATLDRLLKDLVARSKA